MADEQIAVADKDDAAYPAADAPAAAFAINVASYTKNRAVAEEWLLQRRRNSMRHSRKWRGSRVLKAKERPVDRKKSRQRIGAFLRACRWQTGGGMMNHMKMRVCVCVIHVLNKSVYYIKRSLLPTMSRKHLSCRDNSFGDGK